MPAGDKRPSLLPKLGSKTLSKESSQKNSQKSRVNAHEKELAKKLDGQRQSNSGAGLIHKGDIKTEDFLFDSKETEGATIILHAADIVKINREATAEQKEPGLILTIHKLPDYVPHEWVCIPLTTFKELLEK